MTAPNLPELWSVDGLALSDGRDTFVSARELDTAPLRGQDQSVYGRHGVLPGSRRRLDVGSFGITVTWHRSSKLAAQLAFDAILRATAPVHRQALWVRSLGDGSARSSQGTVATSTFPSFLGYLDGEVWQAAMTVRVPGARWTDVMDSTDTTPAGAALPKTLVLASKAAATLECDDLRYLITGPIVNPSVLVTSDLLPGQSFQWTGTVPAGCQLLIDSGAYTVAGTGTSGGTPFTPSIETLTWTSERILPVPPAPPGTTAPSVQLAGSGGGSTTALAVIGRSSFYV